MRLLIDNSVSWRVARDLEKAGHDAVHVGRLGMAAAPDPLIYQRAAAEGRIIITQDADFGPIHAAAPQRAAGLGIVLLRLSDGRPSSQAQVLTANLPNLEPLLVAGAVVVIEDEFIRIQQEER